MLLFNDIIQHLDLIDIPFEGRQFTWSNMQDDTLLEKIDWVFILASWSLNFPATSVKTLSQPISNHVRYVVKMDSRIPRASIFRFENYRADFLDFYYVVKLHWNSNPFFANMAITISGKFKQLRSGLKKWSRELSALSKLINNCHWVLALLDGLEEQRPLDLVESNFKVLVKTHLLKLLDSKIVYWKQRFTSRWIKLGDENSKVFQALASQSLRRNSIPSLTLADGTVVSDHELKVGALWNSFRDRLGISEFTNMTFDLHFLIQPVQLPVMDVPFTKEDIDTVIKEMAPNRAHGPDGFNGFFMNKCWHIICDDFYRLCQGFENCLVDLECINDSYVTLVPKKDCPLTVND
jgi:hypothetical protein